METVPRTFEKLFAEIQRSRRLREQVRIDDVSRWPDSLKMGIRHPDRNVTSISPSETTGSRRRFSTGQKGSAQELYPCIRIMDSSCSKAPFHSHRAPQRSDPAIMENGLSPSVIVLVRTLECVMAK